MLTIESSDRAFPQHSITFIIRPHAVFCFTEHKFIRKAHSADAAVTIISVANELVSR
jgi:hypothetical protein